MDEIWKPVPGYETHYDVSNMGRVRRTGAIKGAVVGLILKAQTSTHGYLVVTLSSKDVSAKFSVHRLVLAAFDKPMSRSFDVRHKDGTRTNNCISNLEWGSRSDNMKDAIAHNRTNRGRKNPSCKLSEADVLTIRADTRPQWQIARDFGVGQDVVSRIKNLKAWGWLV